MPPDKRGAPRRDMRWEGMIVDLGGSIIGRCMVVNISATGAKLAPQTPMDVPDSFVLVLSQNGEVRRQCKVAWRSSTNLGVQFLVSQPAPNEMISYLSDALARGASKTSDGG